MNQIGVCKEYNLFSLNVITSYNQNGKCELTSLLFGITISFKNEFLKMKEFYESRLYYIQLKFTRIIIDLNLETVFRGYRYRFRMHGY